MLPLMMAKIESSTRENVSMKRLKAFERAAEAYVKALPFIEGLLKAE